MIAPLHSSLGDRARLCLKKKKRKKSYLDCKGSSKTLFADNNLEYRKYEGIHTERKRPLELISESGKVARYKITLQNSVVFLYTNN